ncbi:MAG: glycosyltransferase [bacterium]|nr:glycosyltransferase [bacterium]
MSKELVIIYDTPSMTHAHIISIHNLAYYLKYFDKIHITYWSKEKVPEIFEREEGKFIFYPYLKPYNSGYIAGIKFMIWIGRTLWKICQSIPKEAKLVFMPVIPLWAGLPALVVGKLKGKKVVLRLEAHKIDYFEIESELEGHSGPGLVLKVFILKLIYRLSLPFYDLVIGISQGLIREAKKYGARKTVKIPILINAEPFLSLERKGDYFGPPRILYVGQIKKIKGLETLVLAAKALKSEGCLFRLEIAGSVTNPKDEIFSRQLKTMADGLDIEFLGHVPHLNLAEVFQRADVFVNPSFTEALGMAMMEAMASGLPVIATQTSGAKDLVEDGKTGFLVPIKDPLALKEKIKILMENPDLRKKMGEAGRERIEKILEETNKENEKLWQAI